MSLLPYDSETAQVFFAAFLETDLGARMEREGLLTPRNTRLLVKRAQEDAGHDDINLTEFSKTAGEMYWEVLLDGREEVVEVSEPEPQLSSSQKAWREYRIFTDGHTPADCAALGHDPKNCTVRPHSVAECKARARTDAGYATFLSKNVQRESVNTPHETFTNLNVKKTANPESVTAAVRQFALDYRTMSVAQVKSLLSPAASGEVAANHYQKLFDAACAAGLI